MSVDHAVELGEVISLRKGSISTLRAKANSISLDGLTGAFDKSRAEFIPIRDKRFESVHKLFTVVKEADLYHIDDLFGDERMDQSNAERYYQRWKFLKSIGIPVVSSMRAIDEKRVLMGDMLFKGGQFIGKDTYWWSESSMWAREKTGRLSQEEKIFLNIDPNLIKQEIRKIFDIAWKNGVLLPDSDEEFAVLVKPTHEWSVIVKDCGTLQWIPKDKRDDMAFRESLFRQLSLRVDVIRDVLSKHLDTSKPD